MRTKTTLPTVLLILIASTVSAQVTEAEANAAVFTGNDGEIQNAIEYYEEIVIDLKRGKVSRRVTEPVLQQGRWYFPDSKSKREKIAEVQTGIESIVDLGERIEAGQVVKWDLLKLEKGTLGHLDTRWIIRVVQVIDETNMIAEVIFGHRYSPRQNENAAATSKFGTHIKRDTWITGISTETLQDGDEFMNPNSLFRHLGTKRYTTVRGAEKSVVHIEVQDTEGLTGYISRDTYRALTNGR